MDLGKLKKIPKTTKIFDIKKIEKSGESIYAVILRLSKRSYEINKLIKDEIYQKMEKFFSYKYKDKALDEILENKETVGISKLFEEVPHPTVIATQEFLDRDKNID
ncbi:MAG TPA: hypothetical protein VE128_01445 [Candidatus Angelobacter sp.]|jgi:hypothetical protein|nr:hypothetical protein [Candidatus Angelobacter sp.]